MTIRSTGSGWVRCRTARRTDRSCTRSSSIRAIPRISTSPCPVAVSTNRRDGGRTFEPLIKGLEVVEGFDRADITVHDPHCVRLCPDNPDRLYQQNHCGIYRIDRPSNEWVRIGKAMPKRVGDIGFPMVVHPRDADTRVGVPDGRPDRLAAHQPGRQTGGLCDAQRRRRPGSVSTPACPRARRGGP